MIQKFNFKKIIKNEKYLFCGIFLLLGLISYVSSRSEEKPAVLPGTPITEIDEMIPAGHVLLPIELVNREALSSIMGQTAVVDLLTVNPNSMSPQFKVASRVKLIRTPKNPDFFALLVEEKDSGEILSKPGPYFALVQNRKQNGSNFHRRKIHSTVKIQYQE